MSAPHPTASLVALVAHWGRQQYAGRGLDEDAYRAAEVACEQAARSTPLRGNREEATMTSLEKFHAFHHREMDWKERYSGPIVLAPPAYEPEKVSLHAWQTIFGESTRRGGIMIRRAHLEWGYYQGRRGQEGADDMKRLHEQARLEAVVQDGMISPAEAREELGLAAA